MIEPEIAFANLADDATLAEGLPAGTTRAWVESVRPSPAGGFGPATTDTN